MLVLVKTNKEARENAIAERNIMKTFGISYSELQNMPMYVLNVWAKQLYEERKREKFENDRLKWQNQQ